MATRRTGTVSGAQRATTSSSTPGFRPSSTTTTRSGAPAPYRSSAAAGRFVALLDHDDRLATGVLGAVAAALEADGTIDYLYTDEDHLTATGGSFLPVYKPDWSPERFRSHMYTNHLSVLRRELALFGQSSGPVQAFDILLLSSKGSLFVTRPTLANHISAAEIERSTCDIFEWIVEGKLKLRADHQYKLSDAAQAHLDLEGRRTTGKLILEI